MVRKSLTLAIAAFAVLAPATPASAAPGSGSNNSRTLSASNATGLNPAGSFSTQIRITKSGTNLDCAKVTCAIVSKRDHLDLGDRTPTTCSSSLVELTG
ncbi:hypothetical protein [Kibdelosporangium phytohabitans]|uniref:Uncharacterized protein n=1 Tax=Kibdelosporangium phytohabitans TaxID=860235 RepID=A0A0N9I027_9PSEU|nr:hypothetical protein [Kibdelosporangium phytohabitans]ALG11384.1 hypothetical protein AOZ06_34970 [Kibdelosporangium phytohabitans]MBE1462708.1 broad specificity polyphosphatase/5'/3'-nucleotidase SurE [Kibdelosporangium phytohabitans]